jgi:hypothetical protein
MPADVPKSRALAAGRGNAAGRGRVCAFPGGQPGAFTHPPYARRVEAVAPASWVIGHEMGPAKAWSKAGRSSDALSTLRFRTYDADVVSRSTATGLLYAATACAPWIVREASPPGPRPPRLLDRVREAIRSRHYSRRTEKAYVHWIRRFIFFYGKRHPAEMGGGRGHCFPDLARRTGQGRCLHPEPGTQRPALSVP